MNFASWKREVEELAASRGHSVTITAKNHFCVHVAGRKVFMSGTPSETKRAKKNLLAKIRQAERER